MNGMRMGWKNLSLRITVCHHLARLSDLRDEFSYPSLTLMMDSYILYFKVDYQMTSRLGVI